MLCCNWAGGVTEAAAGVLSVAGEWTASSQCWCQMSLCGQTRSRCEQWPEDSRCTERSGERVITIALSLSMTD